MGGGWDLSIGNVSSRYDKEDGFRACTSGHYSYSKGDHILYNGSYVGMLIEARVH